MYPFRSNLNKTNSRWKRKEPIIESWNNTFFFIISDHKDVLSAALHSNNN